MPAMNTIVIHSQVAECTMTHFRPYTATQDDGIAMKLSSNISMMNKASNWQIVAHLWTTQTKLFIDLQIAHEISSEK